MSDDESYHDEEPIVEKVKQEQEVETVDSATTSTTRRRQKLRRVVFTEEADDLDYLPSKDRLTERGGYAHMTSTRKKIAAANRGNVPWNKGKGRSESDRKKISEGVKARNRAILLLSLKKIGMSEEEYHEKKKKLKYLRERLRRIRKDNMELRAELDSRRDDNAKGRCIKRPLLVTQAIPDPDEETEVVHEDVVGNEEEAVEHETEENIQTEGLDDEIAVSDDGSSSVPAPQPQPKQVTLPLIPHVPFFQPEFAFRPHELDGVCVSEMCPSGGPGGLICCEYCCNMYSNYLNATFEDLREQKLLKVDGEVREVIGFLRETRGTLAKSIHAARKKPPPIMTSTAAPREGGRRLTLLELFATQTANETSSIKGFESDSQIDL